GGVDSFFSTLMGFPSFRSSAGLTACSTRSIEKPTHSFCLLTNANGGDAVRVPIVRTPVWLIFSSVLCWASAGAATDSASPSARRTASPRLIVTLRLVGEDFRQEFPGTL